MTGWELFNIRFTEDLKYQRKILGMVINWTTWVYLFLPLVIFGGLFYIDAWQNIASYWIEALDGRLLLVLLLLMLINSKFRSFMHEADQLFLLDHAELYKNFRSSTFMYSILQMSMTTMILVLLALPWLVQLLDFHLREILFLIIFLMSFRIAIAAIRRITKGAIKRELVVTLVFLGTVILLFNVRIEILFFVGVIGIFFLVPWYFIQVIPAKRLFFHEVNEENKERVRYVKFILGIATNIEKPPRRLGKRPFTFRKSRKIFKENTPENGLLEVLLKGLLRHSVYLKSYLQLIGLTLLAIIVFPVWLKWIVFILFILFLQYNAWLKGLYEKMLDEYFFNIVPVKSSVKEAVWPRFKRLLMIPAVSFIGLSTILLTILSIN